jgi:hypothetical protein
LLVGKLLEVSLALLDVARRGCWCGSNRNRRTAVAALLEIQGVVALDVVAALAMLAAGLALHIISALLSPSFSSVLGDASLLEGDLLAYDDVTLDVEMPELASLLELLMGSLFVRDAG